MAANRTLPYGAFNFVVKINGTEPFGGFSDVSGLSTELVAAEYRGGSFPENHVSKVHGLHKVGDVTLKRGVIKSADLWAWINEARVAGPKAKRTVVIQMLAEDHSPVQQWTLTGVMPLKYTAPTFAAKGSGDVAIEELVLSSEGMYYPAPAA
jgi:phage tail-like protein